MTHRDQQADKEASGAGDVVASKFTGTLVSLASESADSEDEGVAYSDGVIAAFLAWRDSTPVRVIREAEASGELAALVRIAEQKFGMKRRTAALLLDDRIRIVAEEQPAPPPVRRFNYGFYTRCRVCNMRYHEDWFYRGEAGWTCRTCKSTASSFELLLEKVEFQFDPPSRHHSTR